MLAFNNCTEISNQQTICHLDNLKLAKLLILVGICHSHRRPSQKLLLFYIKFIKATMQQIQAAVAVLALVLLLFFRTSIALLDLPASVNSATLLFGTLTPSDAAAAPGSCATVVATAEQAVDENPHPFPQRIFTARAEVCRLDSLQRKEFSLVFETRYTSNSTSAPSLAISVDVSQPAAGKPPSQLRWRAVLVLSRGSAGHLDINLQTAHLEALTQRQMQPLKSSRILETGSVENQTASSVFDQLRPSTPTSFCEPLQKPPASQCTPLLLAAALALLVGVLHVPLRRKPAPSKKETCDVACSPFVFAAGVAAAGALKGGPKGTKGKSAKWTRDEEGRLQREGKQGGSEGLPGNAEASETEE